MKRYDYNGWDQEFEQDPDGEWVRYEDAYTAVKHAGDVCAKIIDENKIAAAKLVDLLRRASACLWANDPGPSMRLAEEIDAELDKP